MSKQATLIRWETPPPKTNRHAGRPVDTYTSRYTAIADQLRARPGQWALIEQVEAKRNGGLATKIRMGAMLCFTPAGDFEAVTRQGGGIVRTYARFLGDGQTDV
jgi:hypothetical protein